VKLREPPQAHACGGGLRGPSTPVSVTALPTNFDWAPTTREIRRVILPHANYSGVRFYVKPSRSIRQEP
jgi:hypothetical protein